MARIVVNLIVFIGPLLVFAVPLLKVRERALLAYGGLAYHHHLAFDRRWMVERSCEELLGSPDSSSVSDLNVSVQVMALRVVPVDRSGIAQLVVASGIPMLAVVPPRCRS